MIGSRLAEARKLRGISQSELARQAGLTPAAIWQIERGERSPSSHTLRRLADTLVVSANWLLGQTEDVTYSPLPPTTLFRGAPKLSERDESALREMFGALTQGERGVRYQLSYAEIQASKLREALGMSAPPIDPWNIVKMLQAMTPPGSLIFQEQPQDGFEGCTIRSGGRVGIILNSNVAYKPRRKFTLAHEIGHVRMTSHQGSFQCVSAAVESPLASKQEAEANEFASELILPAAWFYDDIRFKAPSMELIRGLSADRYETSLTATALKYIKISDDPCALVLSEGGKVKWCA